MDEVLINITDVIDEVAVAVTETSEVVSIAISEAFQGDPGADGTPVELQKSATHVQWKLVGDASWTDLVPLSDLTGAPGDPGAPGENGLSVELQNTGSYIQWRLIGGEWQNIIAIADLIPDISTKVDKVAGSSLVADTEIAKIHSSGSDAETANSIIALGIDELEFSLINSFLR